jgi:hypothetical protein
MSLVFYRLYCVTTKQLNAKLKTYKIVICLASVWLIPAVISMEPLLFGFQFNSTYDPTYRFCVPGSNVISNSVFLFIYSVATRIVVPNLSVASVYLYLYLKSKSKVSPVTVQKRFPRVSIQVAIYIAIFEINCAILFIAYYQAMNSIDLTPAFLQFMRIYQWFNNFSPLSLFFLHEVMLKKYKNLFKIGKKFIC